MANRRPRATGAPNCRCRPRISRQKMTIPAPATRTMPIHEIACGELVRERACSLNQVESFKETSNRLLVLTGARFWDADPVSNLRAD
ncbi:hypothetical protein [Aquibium microcysteis]|uniref:hypothetical protein n=1 Tax=Aquibium microcysteis TaxID=675281 RepID=UPI00165D10E1|nr:hypothetical protein [Aquibium microcysteis]